MMTLQDLTHVEVRNQKAARTPKKTCPKCKMQVPVARQRCENCPHQFISNAAPDRDEGPSGVCRPLEGLRSDRGERLLFCRRCLPRCRHLEAHGAQHPCEALRALWAQMRLFRQRFRPQNPTRQLAGPGLVYPTIPRSVERLVKELAPSNIPGDLAISCGVTF